MAYIISTVIIIRILLYKSIPNKITIVPSKAASTTLQKNVYIYTQSVDMSLKEAIHSSTQPETS